VLSSGVCCVHTGTRVVCAAERELEVGGKAALVNLVRVYPVADVEVLEVGRTLVVAAGVALIDERVDEATEVALVQSEAGFGEEVDLEGQEVAAENYVQVAGAIKAWIEEKSEAIRIAEAGAVDVNEESEVPAKVQATRARSEVGNVDTTEVAPEAVKAAAENPKAPEVLTKASGARVTEGHRRGRGGSRHRSRRNETTRDGWRGGEQGRGFTLEELKAAGISKKLAPTIGIAVDHRCKKTETSGEAKEGERSLGNRVEELTVHLQNAGPEVVEAKAGAGSIMLSVAYTATKFGESCMRTLNFNSDVYKRL
jgi:hypothetical protein